MATPKKPYVPFQTDFATPKPKQSSVTSHTAPVPHAPLPIQPKVKTLQTFGVHLSVDDVNRKVERMTVAHTQAFGTKPKPGLVFDLLRSDNDITPKGIDYNGLFGIPKSKREADAMRLARGTNVATLPVQEDHNGPNPKKFAKAQEVAAALDASSGLRHEVYWKGTQYGVRLAGLGNVKTRHPETMGLAPGRIKLSEGSIFEKTLSLWGQQVIQMTADMPFGAFKMGKNLGLDVRDVIAHPTHPGFQRTRTMGKQMAEQVVQDFEHPLENPGYLTADIWGIATLTGAAGARAAEVARTGRLSAVLHKPPPRTTTMGFDGYTESLPLSDSAVVAMLQEKTPYFGRDARQRRLVVDQTSGFESKAHNSQLWDNVFSTEASIRRARANRLKVEQAIVMTPVAEMNRLVRWDQRARSALAAIHEDKSLVRNFRTLKAEQRTGVQKAIQVIFTDDPNPVQVLRAAHEREIATLRDSKGTLDENALIALGAEELDDPAALRLLGEDKGHARKQREIDYSIAAHEAQLQALDLAEKILQKPPKRMQPLLARAYEVEKLQQEFKQLAWGLDPMIAEQHIAEIGAFARGENVIPLGGGFKGLSEADTAKLTDRIAKKEKTLKNAQQRLTRAKNASRLHPTREDFKAEVENAGNALTRHEQEHGRLQRNLKTIQEAATPLERKVTAENADQVPRTGWEENPGYNTVTTPEAGANDWQKLAPPEKGMVRLFRGEGDITPPTELRQRRDARFPSEADNRGRWFTNDPEFARFHLIGQGDKKGWLYYVDVPEKVAKAADQGWGFEPWAPHAGITQGGEYVLPPEHVQLKKFAVDPATSNIAKLRKGGPGSAYYPFEPLKYAKGESTVPVYLRPGRFGIRKPDFKANIKAWSGKSFQMGDFSWDMTDLLDKQMRIAYKSMTQRVQWEDLWSIGAETKISDRHRPIRDIASIPDELREAVQAIERTKLDPKLLDTVTDAKLDAIRAHLYPEAVDQGEIAHVRWVDEQLIMDKVGGVPSQFWQTVDDLASGIMSPINEPMRLLLIFATPAYILNAVGNAGLMLMHEGFLAAPNYGRALFGNAIYGKENTRLLDRIGGQTATSSLVSERNMLTRGSQGMMEGWQKITDVHFRRGAVIHELRRKGILTEKMTNKEIHQTLQGRRMVDGKWEHDQKLLDDITDAGQRARKAMLDFDSMSWPERATLRHLFFVYSFVRASTIWSLRFLRDHGAMSATLAQAGRDREKVLDEMVGKSPAWLKRGGYFAVAPGVIHNPIQWNMPGTLQQITYPGAALFADIPYMSADSLAGPATEFALGTFTGKTAQGEDLPQWGKEADNVPLIHGSLGRSFLSLFEQTPMGYALKRKEKADRQKGLPPPPVKAGFRDPISAARVRESAALNQSTFEVDGFWNQWGKILTHSGSPIEVNHNASEARYWRDVRASNPKLYHQHELDMVHTMVKRQEKAVGEPASAAVLSSVDMVAKVSQAMDDYHRENPHSQTDLNDRQVTVIMLDALVKDGRIKDQAGWAKRIAKTTDPKATQTALLWAAGGKAWYEWTQKVAAIDKYAQPGYNQTIAVLKNAGKNYTASVQAPREDKWAYGRRAEKLLEQDKTLKEDIAVKSGFKRSEAMAAWREFVDANDKPITVKGVTFPSPFEYEFADKTPKERARAMASAAARPWDQLVGWQKEALTGRRPDPVVTKAWQTLYGWLAQAQEQQGVGGRLPNGTRKAWEDYIAKKVPAFREELARSRLPLATRMKTYKPIQNSPNAEAWRWLLNAASERYTQYAQAGYKDNQIKSSWSKYDAPKVYEELKRKYPRFLSELRVYTQPHDDEHNDAFLTKFVGRLVSK